MKNFFNYYTLLIIVFLGIFLFFITQGISLPYVGPYAFNFNVYSIIAHNYNQFGLLNVHFAPIISAAEKVPAHPAYYLHHPPLISIIESFLFKLFGEDFWVGRLTVILFSFGSAILIYCIARTIKNKKFALFALAIYSIMPASSIFGKMIGQEPLVLFFALSTFLLVILYTKSHHAFYIPLIILAVALGVLSDWPMVYFVCCLAPYLLSVKKKKLLLAMLLVSFGTALGFFLSISFFQNGLHDIFNAFVQRSTQWQVHPYYLWPVLWPLAILVRFFIYFNPVFASLSLLFLFQLFKKFRKRQLSSESILYSVLFLFGLIHVLLYPSGSFGHIYWIYYFIPFICFASASMLVRLQKNLLIILGIFIFSFVFLLGVNKWKVGEIRSNLWRYDLAQQASSYLSPYEAVLLNKDSSLDSDVLRYKFQHDFIIASPYTISKTNKHYLYSCNTTCDTGNKDLAYLLHKYSYKKLHSSQGEGYVFLLNKPAESSKSQNNPEAKNPMIKQQSNPSHSISFRQMYIFLVTLLQVPFL